MRTAPTTAAIETFTVADDAAAQQARSRMSAFQRGTAGGRARPQLMTNPPS